MRHVLIITSDIYCPEDPNLSGMFQRQQAEILKRFDYQVGILSAGLLPMTYRGSLRPGLHFKQESDIKIVLAFEKAKIIPARILRLFPFQFIIPKYEKGWLAYLKKFGIPDIIHCHNSLFAGYFGVFLKKNGFKVPVMLTEHSSVFARKINTKRQQKYLQRVTENLDLITCTSRFQLDTLKELIPNSSIRCLNNPIEPFFEELDIKTDSKALIDFTFITIGLLDENKNHALTLMSLKIVLQKFPEVRLKIIGNGPLLKELKTLAVNLGIANNVHFLGTLKRREVLSEISSSSAVVISSKIETFGVTALEGHFLGKPCITTRCGGVMEYINPQNSILIEDNVDSMNKGLIRMIESYNTFDSLKIRNDAIQRFGSLAYYKSLNRFYDELLVGAD